MSGKPAARVGDLQNCPLSDGPKPHVGGPIGGPGAPTVLIGGPPAARMGDIVVCVSPAPNTIAAGAFPVPIANNPAARMTDRTAHGGSIAIGFPTVQIGLAGTTGNPPVGTEMCQDAAAGRTPPTTQQSYNNCGVESSRQIINQATGANLTENGLLTSAISGGNASGMPGAPLALASGRTGAAGRQAILASNGVASSIRATNATNLGLAMSRGQGAVVNLDAGTLWAPSSTPPGNGHAVTVTGVEYDDDGNVVAVIINDTGTGQCGQRIPAARFNQATAAHPNSQLNVTNNAIW